MRCRFCSASAMPNAGQTSKCRPEGPNKARSTNTVRPWDCSRAIAVFTEAVVAPAPPFALLTARIRARLDEERAFELAVANLLSASANDSAGASRSRYSRAPARMAATITDGSLIVPAANSDAWLALEWMSSIACIASRGPCGSTSTTTTSACRSWTRRIAGSAGPAGNPACAKTTRASCVLSIRCWSTKRRSGFSENMPTAIEYMGLTPTITNFDLTGFLLPECYEQRVTAPSDLCNCLTPTDCRIVYTGGELRCLSGMLQRRLPERALYLKIKA